MLGHVNSSANGQLYTIKINKDLLIRLLKRGELSLVALLLSSPALVIYKRLVDVVTWCNGQKDNEDTRDGNEGIDKRIFFE